MSDKEFLEKLNKGLELAEERMLREKAQRGEDVIIYTEEKGIHRVSAREILAGHSV